MNAERRIQRVRRALTPRGECKSDAEILCLLAERLGFGDRFRYRSASEIWDEVRRLWPAVAGMPYRRLDERGLQWPCPSEDHPGTATLHASAFPLGRARFHAIDFRPSDEQPSPQFPLLLVTGRQLHHFNAATMTGRTRNRELRPDDRVHLHRADAAAFGIGDGDAVEVASRWGRFQGRASVGVEVRRGELFATFHNVAALVNRALGAGFDPVTRTPEYKVTAVRIERLREG